MTAEIENKLRKREKTGNLRTLKVIDNLIDFSSNDYLGLAQSQKFIHECKRIGSTGSRLLTGNSRYVEALEKKIAKFHGYEAGLIFGCGYMANIGLISALGGAKSVFFHDTKVHASTHDGLRLSRSKAFPFKHNDLDHLEKRLKSCSVEENRFICIESIYSTDGSKAPLIEICQLAKKYKAYLIVDEAHATGVYGPKGQGLVAEYNLIDEVFAQITTFGKALGTYGAIVLGSKILMHGLINFATPYIYSTALPFHTLASIESSYDLFPKLDAERRHIQKLISILGSETHIHSIPIKGNETERLASFGYDVRPLKSPTVQRGHEVMRICLHSINTETQLRGLLECIKSL